ncbi:MAG: GNAT family N-acetyltransferase [Alphaproteobacteria bacterium]|nr:GNAT family N-acetyltransferase [Alphaproteobacteria bacterium]
MIDTPRLRLLPLDEADREPLARLFADPEVTRFLPQLAAANLDAARALASQRIERYAAQWRTQGLAPWALRLRQDGALVGWCGLRATPEFDAVEMVWLVARAHWGRGLAAEAARAALDYGFMRRGLPRLIALILPGNSASVRLAERLGMRYERHVPVNYLGGGAAQLFRLTRTDYLASLGGAR